VIISFIVVRKVFDQGCPDANIDYAVITGKRYGNGPYAVTFISKRMDDDGGRNQGDEIREKSTGRICEGGDAHFLFE